MSAKKPRLLRCAAELGVALGIASAAPIGAATLNFAATGATGNQGVSFWDPTSWAENQRPANGDDVLVRGQYVVAPFGVFNAPLIFLGDSDNGTLAGSAALGELAVLSGDVSINWGPEVATGNAGALEFSTLRVFSGGRLDLIDPTPLGFSSIVLEGSSAGLTNSLSVLATQDGARLRGDLSFGSFTRLFADGGNLANPTALTFAAIDSGGVPGTEAAEFSLTNGATLVGDVFEWRLSGPGNQLTLENGAQATFAALSFRKFDPTGRARVSLSGGSALSLQDAGLGLEGTDVFVDASTLSVHGLDLRDSRVDFIAGSQYAPAVVAGLGRGAVSLSDRSTLVADHFETGVLALAQDRNRVLLSGGGTKRVDREINLGSNFSLCGLPGPPVQPTCGGDLPGVAGDFAQLELRSGAQLALSDPFTNAPMLLAIGQRGSLTIDPTSSMYIGFDPGSSPIPFANGTLVLAPGGNVYGTGLINATVLNTGGNQIISFSPGTLTIAGEYIQQSGTLTLEIGGVNAGEFDVLDALQGASFLGGTLRFERINNFAGVLGAQLDFFAGRAVSFDPALVIEDNSGFGLAFDFATGMATITQVITPEPPIVALLAAGCVGLGWIGRRRA